MAYSEKAISDANKALSVIFIISIFAANCLLVYKTARKRDAVNRSRSLIVISLAIGDIFLSLFPLIVIARQVFEYYSFNPGCSTSRASQVYLRFLLPFVYGVGLITLAIELVVRYKRQSVADNSNSGIIKSVVYSAIPWLLGLLIVLPLTMAGTSEYDRCWVLTTKRFQVMNGVSVILPACLALIVCIAVMCMRLIPLQYASQTVTFQGGVPGVVLATQQMTTVHAQYPGSMVPSAQQIPTAPPTYYGEHGNQYGNQYDNQYPVSQGGQYSNQSPQYPVPTGGQYGNQNPQYPVPSGGQYGNQNPQYPVQTGGQYGNQNPKYPVPTGGQHTYPNTQYLPPPQPQYSTQPYATNQSNVIVTAPVTYQVQPQVTPAPTLQDPGREKNRLLIISIVFFICVLPFPAYNIDLASYDDVVYTLFFWLLVFRSLITPLIWIGCDRN